MPSDFDPEINSSIAAEMYNVTARTIQRWRQVLRDKPKDDIEFMDPGKLEQKDIEWRNTWIKKSW